jgi:Metallo-peptidase family M12B Reprolysin-like
MIKKNYSLITVVNVAKIKFEPKKFSGLATVGGVCTPQYSCVIAELGTVNSFGKPYPSAGFTSVYILAHEIGHK